MTIDAVDISTYGLRLLKTDEMYSQPARKKVLEIQKFGANDIKFESRTPKLTLFGKYADNADLINNVNAFKNLVKANLKHSFDISEHGQVFTGVVAKGISVEVRQNTALLNFEVTIVE